MATQYSGAQQFERWLPVIAGGAVAAYALMRALEHRPRGGTGTGAIANRHSDTRRRLGGRRGVHVEHSVTVGKPAAELYSFWRDFENLPAFMNHLAGVAVRDDGISRWVAKGPAGMTVEWDARVINEINNKLIAWQSIAGSMIATAGSVTFEETERGTTVHVHMQYNPPAGKVGAAVAWLFGEEPTIQVREDLRRFKQLMETGEIASTEGQPSGRRAPGRRA